MQIFIYIEIVIIHRLVTGVIISDNIWLVVRQIHCICSLPLCASLHFITITHNSTHHIIPSTRHRRIKHHTLPPHYSTHHIPYITLTTTHQAQNTPHITLTTYHTTAHTTHHNTHHSLDAHLAKAANLGLTLASDAQHELRWVIREGA